MPKVELDSLFPWSLCRTNVQSSHSGSTGMGVISACKYLTRRDLELICRRGESPILLFYAAFQVVFDFPQYSDTLRHRTIHTVRTNRIIL